VLGADRPPAALRLLVGSLVAALLGGGSSTALGFDVHDWISSVFACLRHNHLQKVLDVHFAGYLVRHGFVEDCDPESKRWIRIFRCDAFRLKFAGRTATEINVWGDPVYCVENWYWLPNVLAWMLQISRENMDPAVLSGRLELHHEELRRFFSSQGAEERHRFGEWQGRLVK
jgi:hypothetical protein